METVDTEEEVLKDAIKSERSALQAELEAMKAERLAYAAELEQLRQERAALQAEKEQIRAEKEAMEAERKALRLAEEITEKVKRRTGISFDVTVSKEGRGVLRGMKSGSGSRLFTQRKVLPKKRSSGTQQSDGVVGSDNGAIEGDGNWSQGPRTRPRRQTVHQPAVLLSTEEGLIIKRPITKTRETRKRKASTCSTGRNGNQQATVKKHTQPVQKEKVQLLEMDDTGSEDEGGVTFPEAGEEDGATDCDNKIGKSAESDDSDKKGDDLEGLEVRFDGAAILAAPPVDITTNGDDGTDPSKAMQTRNIKWTRASRSRGKLPQVCRDCGRSFRLTSTYLSHIKTHTDGGSSHKRPGYKKTFKQLDQLTKHQNQHSRSAGQRHTCGHCPLTFSSVIRLRKHVHLSHKKSGCGAKEFKCTKCREVFTKASDLARHMGVHSEGKPFKCTHCKSSFNSPGNLTVHMKKHSGEKPFRCDECDATFPRSADLKSHVRKHSTVKPYTCQFCSAAFCRAGDLKPHMRTHTGEKPYQCEVCGAAFSTSSNLAVHRRTHTGERPFQCEQCGDSFSQLGHLTRHRSQHSTENSHRCTTCPASFGNAYHLKVHMQRHNTENTFKCKCGAAFSRASILTEHMRIHTGEKPYRCNQCPAAFARSANLAAHRRKHTGERPYVCPHCQQGFTQSTSLNRHLQSKKACLARHAASHSQLEGDDAPTVVGENGATEGREEAVTFSTVGQEDVQSSSAVGVGDFFHGRGVHSEAHANHFLLPASTHVSTFDGGVPVSTDGGGPVMQHSTEMNHASIFTITDAADNVSQASPSKGFNVADCFSINENTQVIRNSMGAGQKFDYHDNSQHSAMEQSLHGANSITHSMCPQAVTHQDSSFHISQSSAYMAASKSILPEGDGVSNSAILQPQTSADVGNSASQHIVSSLAEANSRMVPLPPIAMVTDYQGGEGSSLVALRNLSHTSSYFHPHVSSPSISHLPQTHSQLPHQ